MKSKLICLIVGLGLSFSGMAQKDLDSIVAASTPLLFDQPDKAIELAEEIIAKSTTPETKVKAMMFMGNAYLSKRQNSKSLHIALQALDIIRKSDTIRAQIEVLNSLGMQHQQLRMYDKAKDYLDEALILTHTSSALRDSEYLLAFNYTIRGFIYREQMNCEIAQNYFDRAISNFKKADQSLAITANISTLFYNKGNCFIQTTEIDSAQISFQRSISFAEKAKASSLLSFAKKGLSEVYTADGKYQLAVTQLLEADSIAANVGDLVLNRGIYQNLANNFLALGNKESYEFYEKMYEKTNQDLLLSERELINQSLQNSLFSIKTQTAKTVKSFNFLFSIVLILGTLLIIFIVFLTVKAKNRFLIAKSELDFRSYI